MNGFVITLRFTKAISVLWLFLKKWRSSSFIWSFAKNGYEHGRKDYVQGFLHNEFSSFFGHRSFVKKMDQEFVTHTKQDMDSACGPKKNSTRYRCPILSLFYKCIIFESIKPKALKYQVFKNIEILTSLTPAEYKLPQV